MADKRLHDNPAEHVKLPGAARHAGRRGRPAQFLTARRLPRSWPPRPGPTTYGPCGRVGGPSRRRAAGLQVGDVELPEPALNPNAPTPPRPTTGRAHDTAAERCADVPPPKTKGSRRRVPLTAATTDLLRDYLAAHPWPHWGLCKPHCTAVPGMRLDPPQGTRPRPGRLAAGGRGAACARLGSTPAAPDVLPGVFRPAVGGRGGLAHTRPHQPRWCSTRCGIRT